MLSASVTLGEAHAGCVHDFFFFLHKTELGTVLFLKVTYYFCLFVSANGLDFLLSKYLNIKKFHLINCAGLVKMSLFL